MKEKEKVEVQRIARTELTCPVEVEEGPDGGGRAASCFDKSEGTCSAERALCGGVSGAPPLSPSGSTG